MRRIWTVDRVMRLLIMAAGVGILLWVLHYLSGVLAPFFAAFLIAYIFDPLVTKIQNKVKFRIAAVIVVLTLMILVVFYPDGGGRNQAPWRIDSKTV